MKSMTRAGVAGVAAVVVCLAATATSLADNPAYWEYFVETFGEDVMWDSNTPVDNTGDEYDISYEITELWAYSRYSQFLPPIWVDVTGYLDPNAIASSGTYAGPPPITVFDDWFVYPEPPEDPGFQANITMTIGPAGYGHLTVTDIVFGTIEVPDFPVPITIEGIRIYGNVTVEAFWTGACCYPDGSCAVLRSGDCVAEGGVYQGDEVDCDSNPCAPPICLGDSNCDGIVSWRDIDFFVAAQGDNISGWEALFAPGAPTCDFANNDVNEDGTVNWRDIDPFVGVQGTTCP